MRKFQVTVNGQSYEVEIEEIGGEGPPAPRVSLPERAVPAAPPAPPVTPAPPAPAKAPVAQGTPVTAPMPGVILEIKVKAGDLVQEGDVVAVLEAMKMENELSAPVSGQVIALSVSKGASVETNETIMTIG